MKQQLTEQQLIQMTRQEEAILQSQEKFSKDLQRIIIENKKSIESLKEIQTKPKQILVKLGPGVLIEAEIKNYEKCKRAFSEKGYKEENIKDTINWLKKRSKNLENQLEKVTKDMMESRNKLNQFIGVLQKIKQEKKKNFSVK